jgi:heme A synthase
VTGPERPPDRDDGLRYPDPRPLRRIQLATVGLIVIAGLVTVLSGSRPAALRWGTLIGLIALILVVLLATRMRRARRNSPPDQNPRNAGK